MKSIKLECARCNVVFNKSIYEHRRRVKQGATRFFCNTKCSASAGNAERLKKGRTLYSWDERIDKWGPKIRIASTVSRIRQRAKKKNLPCELTCELFWSMLNEQDWLCAYSGEKMVINGKLVQNQVTVDRIIPNLGYTKGNMALCCRWANMAKGIDSIQELIKRAEKLVKWNDMKLSDPSIAVEFLESGSIPPFVTEDWIAT